MSAMAAAPAMVNPSTPPDPRSNAEVALGSLLEASHEMAPDDVVPAVAGHLRSMGMSDPAFYVVDLGQRLLVPLGEGGLAGDPLEIDATLAGSVFRSQQVAEEPSGAGNGTRLWFPMLDGADRVGVMGVTVPVVDEATTERARHLASIAAGLLVSKSAFGDNLVLARRRRDTDLAAEMRWSMLPPLTFTSPRVALAGMLEPAYEIAGDAFDYAVNGNLVHLAIIDAMGHSLEASRMANLSVGSYRHSRRHGLGLIETFLAMDAVVADQFGAEKFVTGQLARLDLDAGRLSWVNAGHPRPLLLRNGRPTDDLQCETSLPLGLGSVPTEVAELDLEPGDAVLFLTDGVIEARSPDGELFGRSRLAGLWAQAAASGEVPAEIMRQLGHSVLDHQKGRLQDDATLLLLIWSGARSG